MRGYFAEREMDIIDIQSYEVGEVSGYLAGVNVGYEMGYRSCMLNDLKEVRKQEEERSYFMKQKMVGILALLFTILLVMINDRDATIALLTLPITWACLFSKKRLLTERDVEK